MDSVIPRVMESLRKRNKDPLAGVSELLLSFVAAFEHVPSQRRLALFRSLMDLVGPGEYLFALVLLLQNKLPDNKRIVQFSAGLLDCYQVNVVFEVCSIIIPVRLCVYPTHSITDRRAIRSYHSGLHTDKANILQPPRQQSPPKLERQRYKHDGLLGCIAGR